MNDPTHVTHKAARLGRTALAVLIVLTCLRVWLGPIPVNASALAQIPDSGLQRKQLLDEARRTNALLAELNASVVAIHHVLTSGAVNVRVKGADKSKGTAAPRGTIAP